MGKTAAKSAKKSLKRRVGLKSGILYLCSCCAAILLLFLSGVNINSFISKNSVLGLATASGEESYKVLIGEKKYWQDFLEAHPYYLDGWIQLIGISLDLKDNFSASSAYIKAREIDPNSPMLGPYKAVFGE
jgi:hypothetical protein